MWALWTFRNKAVVGAEELVVDILVERFLRLLRDHRTYAKKVQVLILLKNDGRLPQDGSRLI